MGMRQSLSAFIVVLVLSFFATGQDCPAISITGPVGPSEPGELAPFTVMVAHSTFQPQRLEYRWTSSTGAIENGQGTTSIRIRQLRREALTATVEISGLPAGCPYQASEYAPYEKPLEAITIGEIKVTHPKISTAQANDIKKTLVENPGSQLYVVVYGTNRQRDVATASLLRELSRLKVERSRITVVSAGKGKTVVKFYAVPPGASNPPL